MLTAAALYSATELAILIGMNRAAPLFMIICMMLASALLSAQERDSEERYLISAYPFGLLAGRYSASFEVQVNESVGFVLTPFYANIRLSALHNRSDEDKRGWAAGAAMGANYYFTGAFEGPFLGGYLGSAYAAVGQVGSRAAGSTLSPQLAFGYRWIIGMLSVAPTVGVSYTFALYDYRNAYDSAISGYAFSGLSWSYGVAFALALTE